MTISKPYHPLLFLSFFASFLLAQDITEKSVGGSVGAVTMDGELWNQVALRPVFPFGKFGIALDIVLYIDAEGNIRKDEWDFSSANAIKNTLIDKIYYVRYGSLSDPLYLKVGALDRVTLGYGILVSDYSNTIQYPQVRKVGLEFAIKRERYGVDGFINNFKENVGLLGARVNTSLPGGFQLGLSLVMDRNQYLGLEDSDGDDVPDLIDDFPDNKNYSVDTDGDGLADNHQGEYDIDGDGITDTLDSRIPGWSGATIILDNDITKKRILTTGEGDPILGAAFDISYPLVRQENKTIAVYAQVAKLLGKTLDPVDNKEVNTGIGLVPVGFVSSLGPISFNLEYRIIPGNGRFDFWYWDRSYDIERATFRLDADSSLTIITKESKLGRFGQQKGFYGRFGLELGSLLDLGTEYQNLTGDIWNINTKKFEEMQNQSLKLTLSTKRGFSRIKGASLFYYQRNVPNPFKFEFSESTVMGYVVGIEVSSGITLNYINRRTFTDLNGNGDVNDPGESISITSIETSFSF